MKNYLCIGGKKIELSEEALEQLRQGLIGEDRVRLGEKPVGGTVMIGAYEFLVLEHLEGETALILKGLLEDDVPFGESNNDYRDSVVRKKLEEFSKKLEELVGEENVIEHTVDLTSGDGLRDYGAVREKVSLLTAERYRQYVDVLDREKPGVWWWLATPHSTSRHENDQWVKCVSPSGCIDYYNYYNYRGVRPFCILNSDILVS